MSSLLFKTLRALALIGGIPVLCSAGASGEGRLLELSPSRIEVRTFYSGARVRAQGIIRQGSHVLVLAIGGHAEETFNKKVRFGPIWINSGKVHVSRAPSLFLSFSDQPVEEFIRPRDIARYELDEAAIKRRMQIEAEGEEVDVETMKHNYFKLKVEEGVYQILTGVVHLGAARNGMVPYSVEFNWPKTAPPAHYEVRAFECRDGVVVATSTAPLEVVEVGFPEVMHNLATNKASLYGVMAVLIAAMAGFGIDFVVTRVFGRKQPTAH